MNVSFHGFNQIEAKSTYTSGAPLCLVLRRGDEEHEITIYTRDCTLTNQLIDAINGVFERRAEIAKAEAEADAEPVL